MRGSVEALSSVAQSVRKGRWLLLMLGFGSGLPYPLLGTTLGLWLRETSHSVALIGAFAWATLPYSLKFLWACHLDRSPAPLVGRRFGQRGGWIICAALGVLIALALMVSASQTGSVVSMAAACLIAAFFGASLDTSVDAFRIEAERLGDDQGTLLTAYQMGYRLALLLSDGLVFVLAGRLSWPSAYIVLILLMLVPALAMISRHGRGLSALIADRQASGAMSDGSDSEQDRGRPTHWRGWIVAALIIACYRLPDVMVSPMINPLYHDVGVSKEALAAIHIGLGVASSFLGILVAGLALVRAGLGRTMTMGAVLQTVALLSFAALALSGGGSLAAWTGVAENFAASFTGVALVAYMSRFVSPGHTGAQYAALTCAYSLFGRVLSGLSGWLVQGAAHGQGGTSAYAVFFTLAVFAALPAIVLLPKVEGLGGRRKRGARDAEEPVPMCEANKAA